jgi:hypothetical protein
MRLARPARLAFAFAFAQSESERARLSLLKRVFLAGSNGTIETRKLKNPLKSQGPHARRGPLSCLGLLGFLQLVPTATFELAVGPNWQPDSSGGQRKLHFPFHRVYKLVGLSRRLRRHLGRTPSLRPTQGDSASRSPALHISLSLLRGRRAWPLSRLLLPLSR